MVTESSTTRIVNAIQAPLRWFQSGFQPGPQFGVFGPTGDARARRHQHLEVGSMEMNARGKIYFCVWRLLQPFQKRFCFFDTRYISKDHSISSEFDRH
jgi:hypothetical protein